MKGTSAAVDVDVDVAAVVDYQPPTVCEHSDHNHPGWQHNHRGPATHYVRAIHNCKTANNVYPACALFVKYVQSQMFMDWMCPECGHVDQGRHMVEVVAILNS